MDINHTYSLVKNIVLSPFDSDLLVGSCEVPLQKKFNSANQTIY